MSNFAPKSVIADGHRYDYKRAVLETLECQTCKAVFVTHIPTGVGKLMTEEEGSELCDGCLEMCRNLEITEEHGKRTKYH